MRTGQAAHKRPTPTIRAADQRAKKKRAKMSLALQRCFCHCARSGHKSNITVSCAPPGGGVSLLSWIFLSKMYSNSSTVLHWCKCTHDQKKEQIFLKLIYLAKKRLLPLPYRWAVSVVVKGCGIPPKTVSCCKSTICGINKSPYPAVFFKNRPPLPYFRRLRKMRVGGLQSVAVRGCQQVPILFLLGGEVWGGKWA